MKMNIARELASLRNMTVGQLRERYVEVTGEPSRSGNREHLVRRIAWHVQSIEEGSLSVRARRRAAELARECDLRLTAPRPRPRKGSVSTAQPRPTVSSPVRDRRLPPPGAVIERVYKRKRLRILVLEDGFEFSGLRYRTLSAVAKAITASHVNGYAFFGLQKGTA